MKKITLIALLSMLPATIRSEKTAPALLPSNSFAPISYTDAFYKDMKTKKNNPSLSTIKSQVRKLAKQYGINKPDTNGNSFLQQAMSTGNSSLVSFVIDTLGARPSLADAEYLDWAWKKYGKNGTNAVQLKWKNIYITVTGKNPLK